MKASVRRNDIDWLRVFATYLLFVFHGAMIFSPAPFFHVRNAEVTPVMMILAGFISLWHMPTFFVLAGWSVHASLATRGHGAFVRERFVRLGLPLLAGCVTIGPLLKYFELRSGLDLNHTGLRVAAELQPTFRSVVPEGLPVAPPFHESFLEFLPTFYSGLDRFTWGHLWFLAYLLTFTLLYLPLFVRIIRGKTRIEPLRSAWVYLAVVPLAAIQVWLRPHWPGIQNLYDDWANFAYYSTFFIVGFLLAKHPGFEAAVVRERKRALVVSLGVMVVLLLALLGVVESQALLLAGSAVAGWCFIVAMLGYARLGLADAGRGLGYLRESALPVYILHQPALVVIGYAVVATSLGIAAKYVLIVGASVLVTLAAYHYAVRRVGVLRVLYGLKALPAQRARPVAQPAALALVLLLAWPSDASAMSPLGTWWIEGGAAKVEIERCGQALCGRVAWLRSPLDRHGCELRDEKNPDSTMRERPVLGLRILEGARAAAPQGGVRWDGGSIYDPETGRTYRCTLTLKDGDTLELRGFYVVPLLGRTTQWIRVGSEGTRCRAERSSPAARQHMEG